MVFQLSEEHIIFPNPGLAEEDGLLAIGGDLSVERLKLAYSSGIFPWYNESEPILWYAPHERCVLFPDHVKISKSMKQVLRNGTFTITMNKDFEGVIQHCANIYRKDQDGTWIHNDMQEAYLRLHELGLAHSIEVWHDGLLKGGLYGIDAGTVFCGESMFSLMSNASKAALIWLCQQMKYTLIDCQMPNEHLLSMGAEMIDRSTYMDFLRK